LHFCTCFIFAEDKMFVFLPSLFLRKDKIFFFLQKNTFCKNPNFVLSPKSILTKKKFMHFYWLF
jgi:hypothetical protein